MFKATVDPNQGTKIFILCQLSTIDPFSIQLNSIYSCKVFFETGDSSVTETFKIKAGNMTVPDTERVNTMISVNDDCGSSIDGVATRSACCGSVARFITIQAEGSSTAIKIGKVLVKVALPMCSSSQVKQILIHGHWTIHFHV